MTTATYQVEEKKLESLLIAGIRMRGRYSDCGKGFSQLGKRVGRWMNGKAMNLMYDNEYKETDADFEPCFPISRTPAKPIEGVDIRELPGGQCLSLLHRGPYEEISRSYEKIFQVIHERNLKVLCPSREVYIKGPGMIFKGNPQKYLTEIQMLFESES